MTDSEEDIQQRATEIAIGRRIIKKQARRGSSKTTAGSDATVVGTAGASTTGIEQAVIKGSDTTETRQSNAPNVSGAVVQQSATQKLKEPKSQIQGFGNNSRLSSGNR